MCKNYRALGIIVGILLFHVKLGGAVDENLLVHRVEETKLHTVSFVYKNKKAYGVVKQSKESDARNHFFVVREALASYIAQSVEVPVNRVAIIEPERSFVGKRSDELPAVLLSIAPGIRVDKLKRKYIRPDIKQRWYPYDKPERPRGLSLQVIKQMARHPDLPKIVAFDTFVGNADRTKNNLFYHKKTDSFCGIDLEATFHRNLCIFARQQIEQLLESDYRLSLKEYRGLKKYKKVFKRLVKLFPPEHLYKKFEEFAQQAGFYPGSSLLTEPVIKRCFEHGKAIMMQSYQDAQALVPLLETLLLRHEQRQKSKALAMYKYFFLKLN